MAPRDARLAPYMATFAVAAAYGGPEGLTLLDEPVRKPGLGEVVVDVRAAGVNPIDWKAYSGLMGDDPAKLPMRLGSEAAGVVTAVGTDAVGPDGPVSVGDEVIAYRASGAYASSLVARTSAVVPKPAGMS